MPTFSFSFDLAGWQLIGLIIDYTIKIIAIGYVPEGRRPSTSTAWLLAILLLPVVGLPLFLLMGSAYINKRRHRIHEEANVMIEDIHTDVPDIPAGSPMRDDLAPLIHLNRRLTSLPAVAGINKGLFTDYEATIRRMAEVVDTAKEWVHVEIYIMAWDETTDVFYQALARAVQRGVKVRLLFDQVGSIKYPGYLTLGRRLTDIGVDWHVMLPINPFKRRFRRPDLRNHRKMLIVDNRVGFMGSINMIDRSYLLKRNRRVGRQWVDAMVELEGPIVDSLERVFAVDWYMESDEPLDVNRHHQITNLPDHSETSLNTLQLVPSGPGYRTEPNLRMFNTMVHRARRHLILCSPYFIPDESLLEAVTTACYRGVRVDLLVSEQSDQFMVHHAQSSYYQALLEAGVHIHLFPSPYVLHTKFVLADPGEPECVGIIGSSNMDIRSFGLNYEISLLIAQGNLLTELGTLTDAYMGVAKELTLKEWKKRSWARRYLDNVMRLTSALQ